MQASPITNAWGRARTRKVDAEHFLIFRGRPGMGYNHHHQITSLDARLFATWSDAPASEDEPGQHMVVAVSDDHGETWSAPRALVPPQPGEHGPAIVSSMGIRVHQGRMTAYYGYYDYTREGLACYAEDGCGRKGDPAVHFQQGTHTGIMVSGDAGSTWRGPVARIDRFMPNLRPQPLRSGRLILPGQLWYPYSDDPFGVSGWTIAGISRLPSDYLDDPEGFSYGARHRGDPRHLCEGSFFQTDDGVVHMMLRMHDATLQTLAVTESGDDGRTWSEPMFSDYTDCQCRFHFGRLPDGRYFGVSCPDVRYHRTPMILAASRDGVHFDRHYVLGDEPSTGPRLKGFHKVGRYGYPSYHIVGDTMFVIYSIEKEDIAVCRLPLKLLD